MVMMTMMATRGADSGVLGVSAGWAVTSGVAATRWWDGGPPHMHSPLALPYVEAGGTLRGVGRY